ncbi:UDP-N-acetylglucosamine 2-epimerase [Candidatus Lokiarchaeum ossiferum]|uniref:UDP-N-acetylglucosamine 2-epimerase n=2 Tax=Candidatus Lokiarchaeum ossiferum TaxID=2951803 RepID=A0ABY6HX03_9ARCH|nr:UDP-N-acetylglucosamine 2-epimerase [Candidatus Lokiarchaeum sp. B-35]
MVLSMKKKRIAFLTGTRADYGILKPIMQAIKNSEKFELELIVTGMHLSQEFGNSINNIIKDGFEVQHQFEMDTRSDDNISMAKSVGKGIIGAATVLKETFPDAVIVLGDRTEALAMSISAAYMNIPIIHFSGGDRTGGIDESVRHAITKFAHIHFPATKESANRIIKMGENPKRVFIVGEPSLDKILNLKYMTKEEFSQKFNINLNKPLIVVIQHANTIESKDARNQIIKTLNVIKKLREQTIIIYPNSDSGGREIIKQIKLCSNLDFIQVYKNLSHEDYLNLLKYASVLIGNSSSGITEAPSFKLPVVNIGTRQQNRERGINVIDVDYSEKQILEGTNKALYDKDFQLKLNKCINPYGNGKTSEKVLEILTNFDFSKNILQKINTY